MILTITSSRTHPSASRRWLVRIAVVQMLLAPLPALAETPTVPSLPAASEPAAAGSPPPASQPDRISGDYVKGYLTDTARILASPARWDGSDWLKAGLIIGATSGIYFADADIRNFAQRNQSAAGDRSAAVGNAVGNPFYILPPLALFYLHGHVNDDPKARRTSLLTMESLVISGAFTLAVKSAGGRARPSKGETATSWDGPGLKGGDPSFPSTHATAAFSVASVIAEEYGTNPYVPPLAYGLATLTGMARIYDNRHWASDVVFGGAVGYLVGKAVVRYHSRQSGSAVTIMPTVTQQGFGLKADYRF